MNSNRNLGRLAALALAVGGAMSLLACASPASSSHGGFQDQTEGADDAGANPKSGKPAAPPAKPANDAGSPVGKTPPAPPPPPNPGPGTSAAAPSVNSLSPSSALANAAETPLTVLGSNFITGAKVKFGAVDLATTFNGPGSLTARIPTANLASPGSVPITVVNPAPSPGISAPVAFTVANRAVAITTITPTKAPVGSGDVLLTVNGTGFAPTAKVTFNGAPLGTTFVGASKLTANVPASSLANAGSFPVVVISGGGVSTPAVFSVEDSKPSFDTFSPGSLPAGSPWTYVTINGRGFDASSRVSVNGYIANTVFDSSSKLRAVLEDYDLAFAGTVLLRVYNSSSTGTATYADSFGELTVTNAASSKPILRSYAPSAIYAGSDNTYVTVQGSNFDLTTGASIDGYVATVFHDSPTQISVLLTSADLAFPATLNLSIYNDPGAGSAYYADTSGSIEVY